MGRPKKRPNYDSEKVMNELLDTVVEEYKKSEKENGGKAEIKSIAAEIQLAPHKIRKLLITAGIRDETKYYSNVTGEKVLSLHKEGKSVTEIMKLTGLNRTSVCCYLPYSKGLYNAKELSLTAEAIIRYRKRKQRCAVFMDQITAMDQNEIEEYLWDTLQYLEGCLFYTSGRGSSKGNQFSYKLKGGEMFVSRKAKSITKSTIMLAFAKAREIQKNEGYVSGPKKIGTFGASYLYPIFLRLGICTQQARTTAAEETV